jgi:hypothetical protein
MLTYPPVIRSNQALNLPPSRATSPCFPSVFGFRRSAESAGLRVRALKAEMSTEMAMVTANCW